MNGGILREVQGEEGDEEPHSHDHEEQEAGDHRDLPSLQHEDVQDWREQVTSRQTFLPRGQQNLLLPPTYKWMEYWSSGVMGSLLPGRD